MSSHRFGLIGAKLGHSLSPEIHARFGTYRYDLIELAEEELADFLTNGDFDGLNVTIPYKKAVIPFCAELTPRAKAIGSVNTIVRREDGTLLGDNTDYAGFLWMTEKAGVEVAGKKCLVLGSGGASLTCCAVLRDLGASEVVTISRSGPDNYTNLERHADAALIVNATPVGMHPAADASPLPSLDGFPKLEGVLDIIYNPLRTDLLAMAAERGLPAVNGLGMLVTQAKVAAEHFLGRSIPDSCIEGLLSDLTRNFANVVLVGMPGAGKTSVGRILADRLRRPFVDTDERIEAKAGMSTERIFCELGEAAFREIETSVLEEISLSHGIVIATGGGSLLREKNRRLLKRNGQLYWLRRPIKDLPVKGRPLSQARGVEAIYAEREPIYRGAADRIIDNVTVKEAVSKILGEDR